MLIVDDIFLNDNSSIVELFKYRFSADKTSNRYKSLKEKTFDDVIFFWCTYTAYLNGLNVFTKYVAENISECDYGLNTKTRHLINGALKVGIVKGYIGCKIGRWVIRDFNIDYFYSMKTLPECYLDHIIESIEPSVSIKRRFSNL